MTREYAKDRAEVYRQRSADRRRVGLDTTQPFGTRYAANVQADEFLEIAERFEGLVRSLAS